VPEVNALRANSQQSIGERTTGREKFGGARLPKDRKRLTTDLAFRRDLVCCALARAEPCPACATSSKVGSIEGMSRSCGISLTLPYAGTGSARATVLHIMPIYKAGIRCRRCLDVREPRPTKFNANWLFARSASFLSSDLVLPNRSRRLRRRPPPARLFSINTVEVHARDSTKAGTGARLVLVR